jgi:uncharacterized protein with GYD domain
MGKYLIQSTYTTEGLKGLSKDGGTGRRDAVGRAVKALGGALEAFYFAFGDTDVFAIVELPDNVAATATSLIGNAAGTHKATFTVLITPEEVDQATELANKTIGEYRPPGQEG